MMSFLNSFTKRHSKFGRHPLFFLLLTCALLLPGCGEQQPLEEDSNVLIYAALNPMTKKVARYIERFNEAHTDIQIEVHDYSDEGGRERLQTELLLGKVPDIMELRYYGKTGEETFDELRPQLLPGSYTGPNDGYYMPYRQMAQKGYLEDLWPYIDNDPDLGREDLLVAPLKAAEVNGGLYMLFERMQIFTLIARASVVGDRYSWTMEDMMDIYAAMPEGSTIMRYNMTRREIFYNLLSNSLERFVDRKTGESSFDSEGFCTLVAFLETLPDEVDYEDPVKAEEEIRWRIQDGTQLLEGMSISWPQYICLADSIFQERAAFVGYPMEDGSSGSFFYLTRGPILAMSSTCRNKEAAWEYMRMLITPYLRKSNSSFSRTEINRTSDIPVNQNDYEAICWYELAYVDDVHQWYPDNPLENYFTPLHFKFGPKTYFLDFVSEKDFQRQRDLIDHTTQLYWPEDDLSDIVWETLGPYFAGDRTLDDTIGLIQNRVQVYLHEQM